MVEEWNSFTKELNIYGVYLNNSEDQLVWSWDTTVERVKEKSHTKLFPAQFQIRTLDGGRTTFGTGTKQT